MPPGPVGAFENVGMENSIVFQVGLPFKKKKEKVYFWREHPNLSSLRKVLEMVIVKPSAVELFSPH